jgi:nucleotide-binding universal stress UspA family protein
MFKNILVPLDGSKLSEASLAPAAFLAQTLKSPVTLLHIIEQDAPTEVHKERHLTRPDEAEAYLKEAALRAFPPGVKVETHVHTAPVADVVRSIVEHATTEFQPDLIVTCTHGRGGMRAVLFGNIAQQVVAQGATPLLLIKPGASGFKLDKILVPLDPDSAHDDSLPLSASLAKSFHAELHLLSVVPTFSTLGGEQAATGNLTPATTQALLDMKEENARKDLHTHIDQFQKAGLKASAEVARGDPASTIVKAAEQSSSDMIILSTHGKAGMGAFWARSVAPKVAQRTKTPLLLIPLPQSE